MQQTKEEQLIPIYFDLEYEGFINLLRKKYKDNILWKTQEN